MLLRADFEFLLYNMKISIIGAGYVGLVTGAVFSDFGNQITLVDISRERIEMLKSGKVPFYEPGLEEVVVRNINQGRLSFTTDYSEAISGSGVVFICVGTPPKENGEADLSYLYSAIEQVLRYADGYLLLVIKSTVPIGVEEEIESLIKESGKEVEVASCPEFLREGSAVNDTLNPDRVVMGTNSPRAANLLLELHKPVGGSRIICDIRSAQMIKYVANSFLATKISFANTVALMCEKTGADVDFVLEGVGADKRIGRIFMNPGVGYGGSCFPKDLAAFINIAEDAGYDYKLLKAVQEVNEGQVGYFIEKVEKRVGGVDGKYLTVLGLSFKPDTDDMREAPSIKIINRLREMGAKIKAYDPVAMENAKKILGNENIEYVSNLYDACKDSEALLIVTEWNEFKEMDLGMIRDLMSSPKMIDGRNIFDPNKVRSLGFEYQGVGRR